MNLENAKFKAAGKIYKDNQHEEPQEADRVFKSGILLGVDCLNFPDDEGINDIIQELSHRYQWTTREETVAAAAIRGTIKHILSV